MEDRLFNTTEVAHAAGLSRGAVLYALRKGRLVGTRLGRDWAVRGQDLLAFRRQRAPKRPREKGRT